MGSWRVSGVGAASTSGASGVEGETGRWGGLQEQLISATSRRFGVREKRRGQDRRRLRLNGCRCNADAGEGHVQQLSTLAGEDEDALALSSTQRC
jgi:hypothetical protein